MAPVSANTCENRRRRADPQAARFQHRAVASLLEASTVENTTSESNGLLGGQESDLIVLDLSDPWESELFNGNSAKITNIK